MHASIATSDNGHSRVGYSCCMKGEQDLGGYPTICMLVGYEWDVVQRWRC